MVAKQMLIAAGMLLLIAAAAEYGSYYWTTSRFLVSTDDAYVEAHSVLISPKVSGYLSDAPVDDNQRLKVGEVLARIDPRNYQTALDQARANVAAAKAAIDTLNQQIGQQMLVVEQSRHQVASDRGPLTFSQQDFQRYTQLAKDGYGTTQRAQQAQADISEKDAGTQHDIAVVSAAERQIGVLKAQVTQAAAKLAQQQAMEHQAELNLSYTIITAPVDGTLGVRTLQVGQYVQAGTQLMAVVPLQAVYIVANYKETQLTDVRPGQPVTMARCIALAGSGKPCDMKNCCKSASRLRVAGWSSETCGVMMAEWNCSRLVKNVPTAAVPIAPPRLRIMLKRPDAPPAS